MSKVVNKELRQDIPAARTGTTIKRYSPSTIDDPDHPFCLPIRSRVGFITGSAGSQDHHKNWFNVLAVGHPPQSEFPQGRASVAVSASFMGDIQLLWPTIDQRFVLFLQRFAHSGRRTEVPRLTICSKKSSYGWLSPFHGERAADTERQVERKNRLVGPEEVDFGGYCTSRNPVLKRKYHASAGATTLQNCARPTALITMLRPKPSTSTRRENETHQDDCSSGSCGGGIRYDRMYRHATRVLF